MDGWDLKLQKYNFKSQLLNIKNNNNNKILKNKVKRKNCEKIGWIAGSQSSFGRCFQEMSLPSRYWSQALIGLPHQIKQ